MSTSKTILQTLKNDNLIHQIHAIGTLSNNRVPVDIINLITSQSVYDSSRHTIQNAIKNGNLQLLKLLISSGENIQKEKDVILFAAKYGHLDVFKYLVEEEKLNIQSRYTGSYDNDEDFGRFQTPFEIASEYGHLKLVQYIFGKVSTKTNLEIDKALCSATGEGHLEVVKYLIYRAEEYNLEYVPTLLLTEACIGEHIDVVKYFIAEREMHSIDNLNNALEFASSIGNVELVQYLLRTMYNKYEDKVEPSGDALLSACGNGYLDIVKLLVHFGANVKYIQGEEDPIGVAVWNGHFQIVEYLIQTGVKTGVKIDRGVCNRAFLTACKKGFRDIAELLIRAGANPKHHLAMQSAVQRGHQDIVDLLIQNGAKN